MNAPTTDTPQATRDAEPTTTHFYHDWDGDDPLSTRIVTAVADVTGEDEREVAPLYDTIDPDCLEALFAPGNSDHDRSSGLVRFSHGTCRITVHGTGFVIVEAS